VVPRVAGSNPVIHPEIESLEEIQGFFCAFSFLRKDKKDSKAQSDKGFP
jgi:hypothetical protein